MRRATTLLLAAVFLLSPWTAECADRLFLQVLLHPEGVALREEPVRPGDTFQLAYTHSSDGTPVLDLFRVEADGRFVLLEERYRWFGAGLESHAGSAITFQGEWTRVRVNRVLEELLLRIGRVSRQEIRSGNARIVLAELAPGGSLLMIRVVRRGV